MNTYDETKSSNDIIYSIPNKNITKALSNNVSYQSTSKKEQRYAHSNPSIAIAGSSRGISSESPQAQNCYRSTKYTNEEETTLQNKNDSFFDMLQDYKPAVMNVIGTNQRSPGPAEFMQDKEIKIINKDSQSNLLHQTDSTYSNTKITRDLKVKNKIHRFLIQPKPKTDDNTMLGLSVLTKNCTINEDMTKQSSSSLSSKRKFLSPEEMQEQQRQRLFGHYDCQSLAASMNFCNFHKKTNASSINTSGVTTIKPVNAAALIEPQNLTQDFNYGNELLKSCSHFCNETGGENDGRFSSNQRGLLSRASRRLVTSCNVSILESLKNQTLWQVGVCPFQNDSCPLEYVDHGAHYYKHYFYNQKHENWFGMDENLGPVAISIRKEKINGNDKHQAVSHSYFQHRIIIRNSELLTLRGLIIEDSTSSEKPITSKELLENITPDIQLGNLRLGLNTPNAEQQLLKLDEQCLQSKYKVGILYCRSGQSTEEDMYNNEHAGPAFTEFLDIIGKRVRLKGFQHYKAGLDNKSDSTGTHSVYAFYKNCEIMFHVCTMLPFTPNNRQQLLRKRHIGNDIVTIVFQEPGAMPFDPNCIRSQFQHVFLIVRVINPCSSNTTYRVAITRSKEVPVFGPPLPASALFSRNKLFAEFILAKTINAENASHRSEKFSTLAIRTRREYLKDLCINYSTSTSIDHGNKFSIFPNRKKEKTKIRLSINLSQRGAVCWRIFLQNIATECLLGISTETFVIIEKSTKSVIFAMPTRAILGWSSCDESFKLFYHNGECMTFNMFDSEAKDEQLQVVERLKAVTLGNGAIELNMRRNMMGQLGFHVQPDGIVTQVDSSGQAWAAGLRRGYRLVEVCKVVVATLLYADLIDLLKTSAQMNAIVIMSTTDGFPRLGCFNKNCKVNVLSQEFLHSLSNKFLLEKDEYRVKNILRKESEQHSSLNFPNSGPYEQHSLPHKSKSNSCYSTPSSCFSSNSLDDENKKAVQQFSSNSSISLTNDKWYENREQLKSSTYGQSNHSSPLKSFENSFNTEEPLASSSSSFINDGLKVETFLQNGTSSSFSQTDNRKLQCRNPEYNMSCKNADFSQTVVYNINTDTDASRLKSFHGEKLFQTNSEYSNKTAFRELTAIPSTSVIKTAKVGAVCNDFHSSMKKNHQSISNCPRTKEFQPDLLQRIGHGNNSYSDQFNGNSIFVVEKVSKMNKRKDKTPSFTIDKLNQLDKNQPYENSSDDRLKKHQEILRQPSSYSRRRQTCDQSAILPSAPPLLPYSKELDWTTLVDTATKAIILQHNDENS